MPNSIKPTPREGAARWLKDRDGAVLTLISLLGFGIALPTLGFYVDDWTQMLGMLTAIQDQSLLGLIKGFDNVYFYLRPLNLVYYPLTYWIGGFETWRYQLMYLAMDTAGAVFLYHALIRASGNRRLSFLTACLYILYPNHGGARFWNNQIHPSHLFFGAAMHFYARWLTERKAWQTSSYVALLLLSGLNYEAYVPLCLFAPFLGTLRSMHDGRPWRKASWTALLEAWPVYATTVAVLAYNVAIQKVYPSTISRGLIFEPAFAWKVIGRGIECSTTAIFHLLAKILPIAMWEMPVALVLGALPAAALIAWLVFQRPALQKDVPAPGRVWLVGGVILLVVGYLPYAFSADRYVPHIFDAQNRINAASSLGAAMLLALGLERIRKAALARVALFGILAVFMTINWYTVHEWGTARTLQMDILAGVRRHLSEVGEGPAIVTLDAPTHHGITVAPVFPIDVEFDRALRMLVRKDLRGSLASDGAILASIPPELPRFLYKHATDEFRLLRQGGASASSH